MGALPLCALTDPGHLIALFGTGNHDFRLGFIKMHAGGEYKRMKFAKHVSHRQQVNSSVGGDGRAR